MAEATLLNVPPTFAIGMTVKAFEGVMADSGDPKPTSAALDSALVDGNGNLFFDSLPEEGVPYVAGVKISGAWRFLYFTSKTTAEAESAVVPPFRIPHTFAVQGEVTTADIPGFVIPVGLGGGVTLRAMHYRITDGTNCKIKLVRNGVALEGFQKLTVSLIPGEASGEVTLADKDFLKLVVESVSGTPENLSVTLVLEHTH